MPDGEQAPQYVYRAVRSKGWIKNGVIQENAFRRRPLNNPHPDTFGLSVDYTHEAAEARFQPSLGVIKLNLARLESIGLRIEPHEDHANICEVPFDEPDNLSDVLRHARAIIGCCE
jgi:hypothetical protein